MELGSNKKKTNSKSEEICSTTFFRFCCPLKHFRQIQNIKTKILFVSRYNFAYLLLVLFHLFYQDIIVRYTMQN